MKIFRAVVEDNKDPEKLARVKVRIFGMHGAGTSGFETVTTSDLVWAEVMGSTAFGLIGGVGVSSVLHQGTWVWVILEDDNPNKPIVIGTVIGKAESGSGTFCDPDGKFPKSDRTGRSDLNPVLDSKYTTLQTIETASGHLIELDDSDGDCRIKVTHKTGSSVLIDNDGNIIVNGVKDASYTIAQNTTWKINGNLSVTVAGTTTMKSGGNTTIDAPQTNCTQKLNVGSTFVSGGEGTCAGISVNHHTHTGVHGETSGPH